MLIFDFDGIIINSVNEVVVTAYNTGAGSSCTALSEIPESVVRSFLLNRFHFRLAGESVPLMNWCRTIGSEDPERILGAAEYAELIAADASPIAARTAMFFATRAKFIARAREAWLRLNAPYQPIFAELQRVGAERVVILTNKNRDAVIELTHHYGLPLLRENVYSGDGGRLKGENMLEIAARFAADRYFFIDDSLENLIELDAHCKAHSIRFNPLLGSWGYLGPNDAANAAQAGYPSYTQQDLINLVNEELSS